MIGYKTVVVAVALAALGPASVPALASPQPQAVVELFTSQGCSSCPPADAMLVDLTRRPGIVALTWPVDYWDYLGWKDTLARPSFSARQRAYASGRGDREVYTPQMIVNGAISLVGSDRAQIERATRGSPGRDALPVPVGVTEKGSVVAIEVGGASAGAGSGEVWVLPVAKAREVAIGRGENRGRTITYANVVRAVTQVGAWRGAAARFEVPLEVAKAEGADGYVVILQASTGGAPGAILGAAKGPNL